MSDDLVKRLRGLGDHASFEPHMHHTAADRIEELEAKLAKAMRHVTEYSNDPHLVGWAKRNLAELKGGQ